MKRLLIIRHGQSEWNALGLWQGQADSPLSPLGEQQAIDAAPAVKQLGVSRVVTSNLMRARQTGLAIASGAGLAAPVQEPLLAERDAGEWSGLNKDQIEEQYPGWIASGQRPPGYEPDAALLPRVVQGLSNVAALDGDPIAVVAHGGVVYVLEEHLGAEFRHLANLGAVWITVNNPGDPQPNLTLGDRVELISDATTPTQI